MSLKKDTFMIRLCLAATIALVGGYIAAHLVLSKHAPKELTLVERAQAALTVPTNDAVTDAQPSTDHDARHTQELQQLQSAYDKLVTRLSAMETERAHLRAQIKVLTARATPTEQWHALTASAQAISEPLPVTHHPQSIDAHNIEHEALKWLGLKVTVNR